MTHVCYNTFPTAAAHARHHWRRCCSRHNCPVPPTSDTSTPKCAQPQVCSRAPAQPCPPFNHPPFSASPLCQHLGTCYQHVWHQLCRCVCVRVCVCVLLHISKECPFEGMPFRRSALLIPLHSRPSQISSRPPLLCPHTACNGSTIRPSTIRPLHGPGLISCHDKIQYSTANLPCPACAACCSPEHP